LSLAAALFLYDTVLTFDQEVAYFWTTKCIGGASLLFFANKWISMMVYVMEFVSFASLPSDKVSSLNNCTKIVDVCSCSLFSIAMQVMVILQFIPGAAFSALRAYVLSRSKPLGLVVAALSLAPVGANLVNYGYQYSGENFPPFGCLATDNITATLSLRFVTIISRFPLITADIILIYITWTTLRGSTTLTDIQNFKRLTLSDILFCGGTILFIMNVLHLVLSATAVNINLILQASTHTKSIRRITAILISRFLLELQEANHMAVKLNAD
ncbi:hypothetical protein OH76DRAFT_1315869, partial [Lentinus brumalis]